jgi:streptogramin lyase
VNEKLYWSDACADDIEVLDPNTGHRQVLVNTGTGSDPRAIVLDPSTR